MRLIGDKMAKHIIKTIVAALLIASILVSAAACGSKPAQTAASEPQKQESTVKDTETKEPAQQETPAADPSAKPEEPASAHEQKPAEPAQAPVQEQKASESAQAPAQNPTPADPAPAENPEPEKTDEPEVQAVAEKILVVYFSRTGEQYGVGVIDEGNTAIVAKTIAEKTGADTFEILPETDYYPYTYSELTDIAKQEQADKARPAIKGTLPDLSQYSTVFIGAPVWWGDWPMIMYTYFESADLSGKTLAPFCTHEGSGLSGFDKKLAKVASESTVLKGLAIRGQDCQNDKSGVSNKVSSWLSDLGY